MASNNQEWAPKHVHPPEKNPHGRTFYDWNDPKLESWKMNALQMQEAHVMDNNLTEYFAYQSLEGDALALRILMTLYGIRIPQAGTREDCPMKTYSRDQRIFARKMKQIIVNQFGSSKEILFNVIYISAVTRLEDSDDLLDREEPVFVLGNLNRKFIDSSGNVYQNFTDYKENNNLPKGAMLYPQNGSYTPTSKDGKVVLELDETPSTRPGKRIRVITDKLATVGGVILSVTGVATFAAPALFSATAMSAISCGSFILSSYNLIGAAHSIYHKTGRDESIQTEVLLLISSLFSGLFNRVKLETIKCARQGKTLKESFSTFQKYFFNGLNLLNIISSCSALISSFCQLLTKKERTYQDYFQFSMALFMTTNVLTKPMTIQKIFESEQMKHLEEIQKDLQSNEAKQEMSKVMEDQSTSNQKAYMIRYLNQIESPTEFFELVNQNGNGIDFTPDGLVVDKQLEIHPRAYNEIGREQFKSKLEELKEMKKSTFTKQMLSLENLEQRLNETNELPDNERKLQLKELFVNEDMFEESWNIANTETKEKIEIKVKEIVGDLQQGSYTETQKDFESLQELSLEKVHCTLAVDEEQKLQDQWKNCSRHRKQAVFHSLEHREIVRKKVAAIDEKVFDDTKFLKNEIATFTSGQYERLCLRVDVDFVKSNVKEAFGVVDVENISIRNVKVFKGLNMSEYDAMNRVLREHGNKAKEILISAGQIANDSEFHGEVKTVYDMTAITKTVRILKKNNMDPSKSEQYEAALNEFNKRIDEVMRLDEEVKSQWRSPLVMTYHWMKHGGEFGKQSLTCDKYFTTESNNLFQSRYKAGFFVTQTGDNRENYLRSFGVREHFGVKFRTEQRISTQYIEEMKD